MLDNCDHVLTGTSSSALVGLYAHTEMCMTAAALTLGTVFVPQSFDSSCSSVPGHIAASPSSASPKSSHIQHGQRDRGPGPKASVKDAAKALAQGKTPEGWSIEP